MNVTVNIPDDLARLLGTTDIERRVLETLALDEYRLGHLSKAQLRRWLAFETRMELDAFLKAHDCFESYTLADLDREREDLQRLGF
jgi:Uncharacterised protein family (UPF0175)